MSYVNFGRKSTKAEALKSTNKDKIFFPTDDTSIILGGKEYGANSDLKTEVSTNTTNITNCITRIEAVENAQSTKQDSLTPGTGIEIENNVISVTLDTTLFLVVTELPTENIEKNRIYLVPGTLTEELNVYTEYLYLDGVWEKLGEVKAKVDLSGYYTKDELDALLSDVNSEIAKINEKITEINGELYFVDEEIKYDRIDLGIKTSDGSTLYWATCNVGANNPEEYGDFFTWGSTIPNNNDKCYYDDPNLPYHTGSSADSGWTKYVISTSWTKDPIDGKKTLDPEDDAANVIMGGNWRMPTYDELYSLSIKGHSKTTRNGISGFEWNNNGQTLFIPSAGYRVNGKTYDVGSYSRLWSSLLSGQGNAPCYAADMQFPTRDPWKQDDISYRYYGQTVRAVTTEEPVITVVKNFTPIKDVIIEIKSKVENIPTKLSELENDTKYVTQSSIDFTGYATETYVDNKAKDLQVPRKVSDVYNDSGYISHDEMFGAECAKYTEYVDLGLPSGLLWAKSNVGAETETDSGLSFLWGEIIGRMDDSERKPDYPEYMASSNTTSVPLEYDSANSHLGGSWHMPTVADFTELYNNTTVTNVLINGVYGLKFTNKTDSSKYIFIPTYKTYSGSRIGQYWTSTGIAYYRTAYGQTVSGGSITRKTEQVDRTSEMKVRGVISSPPISKKIKMELIGDEVMTESDMSEYASKAYIDDEIFTEPSYVDLGLPSGLLWAKCNVGANKETDYGLYFQWGDVEGHKEGDGYVFSNENYISKGLNTISTKLDLEHDAAHVIMGENWRMPTTAEFLELLDNTNVEYVHYDDSYYKFTNKTDESKYILIPIAGIYEGSTRNFGGRYWTSEESYSQASCADLNMQWPCMSSLQKYNGISIRGVIDNVPTKKIKEELISDIFITESELLDYTTKTYVDDSNNNIKSYIDSVISELKSQIEEKELVVAAALNDLNVRIGDSKSDTI